jgi:hypothetical protein
MKSKVYVAHMEEVTNTCRSLIRKVKEKRQFSRSGYRWKNTILSGF